ncbi:hypothetical protein ACFLY4_05310 [Chloroflexota bacterium]
MPRFLESAGFFISLPERSIRALAASLGGVLYEATEFLLPGWLRRSRFYQGLVVGTLRIAIELVGGVSGVFPSDDMDVQEFTMRKAAGTGIEMAGFLTIGWSPVWLFAVAADLSGGTRAYLQELVFELKGDGMLSEDADVSSIEELLDALEGSSGIMVEALDVPPLNVPDMRSSRQEMRQHATDLPEADRLASLYRDLHATADQQDHSMQYMSSLIATGALRAGVNLGQTHVFDYYQDALNTINSEGLPVYSRRVARPYFAAAKNHFDPKRISFTERLFGRRRKVVENSGID